jgi:5,10-methylenetetrahydromethanopterin reductase
MKIDFSVGMGRHLRIDQVAEHARAAEANGFKQLTFIDSQNLSRDVHVMMTIAALNTNRILIGPAVSNTFTRHVTVTANAIGTLDELSGGRAWLGLGGGLSALWTMGEKTRPLRELREQIEFIRTYMSGDEAGLPNGENVHSGWIRKQGPIYVGSGGPKSLRQAGALCDGVIFGNIIYPDVVRWRVNQIKEGAREAGRDPESIDIWVRAVVYITDDKEAAIGETGNIGTQAVYGILQQPHFAEIASRLEAKEPGIMGELKAVADAYRPYYHEEYDAPHGKLATTRVVELSHLVGTADEIAERIQELDDCGVTNISHPTYTTRDKIGLMDKIGDQLIARFS